MMTKTSTNSTDGDMPFKTAWDVAEWLGVDVSTVYQWLTLPSLPLPAHRVGKRHYIFDAKEVESWALKTGKYPRFRTGKRSRERKDASEDTDTVSVEQRLSRLEERVDTLLRIVQELAARPTPAAPAMPVSTSDKLTSEHMLEGVAQRIISALGQNDRDILAAQVSLADRVSRLEKVWE